MYIFTENVYWEMDSFKCVKKEHFCSAIGETQYVDMQIYYIIKTKYSEIIL